MDRNRRRVLSTSMVVAGGVAGGCAASGGGMVKTTKHFKVATIVIPIVALPVPGVRVV